MSSDPNAPMDASYELQLRNRQRRMEFERRRQQQLQQWQQQQVQNPTNQQTLNTLTTHNIHNTRYDHRRDYYYDNRYRQSYINSDNNTNRQYNNYGRHYQSDNGVVNVFDHPPQPPAQMPPPPQQIPANRPPPPQAAPQPAGPLPGPPPRPAAANGGVPRVAAVAAVAPVAPVAPARLGGGGGPDLAAPPVLGQFYVPPLEPVAQGQVGTGQFYAQYSVVPRAGGGGFGGFGGTGSVGVKQEYQRPNHGYSAHGHYNDQKLRQRVANGFENALNSQDIMMPPAAVKQEKQEMKVFDLVADEEDEETESEDNGMGMIAPNMKPNKALDGLDSAMGGGYDVSSIDYQGNGSNQTFADSNMQPPNQLQGFGGGAAAGAMSNSGQQEGAGLKSVQGGPGAVHEDLQMFSDTNKGKNQYNVTPPTAMVGGEGVGRLGKQLNNYNGARIDYDYSENNMNLSNGKGSFGISSNTSSTFDKYGNVKSNHSSGFGGVDSEQTK